MVCWFTLDSGATRYHVSEKKSRTNYSLKLRFVVLSLHLVHILTKVAEGEGGRQLSKKLQRWLTLHLVRGRGGEAIVQETSKMVNFATI
jgi:hypothetical protein